MNVQFVVTSSEDQAALELTALNRNFFVATLRSNRASGMGEVGTFMSSGLADLFEFFADNWKGWDGSKLWGSLEGELSIAAHSDRLGHVYLTVKLREGAPAKWTLEANLVVDAGNLPALARVAREFETAVLIDA
jgi:uncharacterized protein DUF6228